ncbi:hypothetical protein [Lentzea albidocapillata]|uniref:Uncharacterized protein n=1 Tax=Lentzea albidocapillata TaxID=40571 RepID=A0A1W2A1S2_9PSEU|nr:hypothetical protein [Lentzea albidocapillata]SMC54563.1 hypothetical protein SAMN05660733_00393 [Lentzea albidocapillata]
MSSRTLLVASVLAVTASLVPLPASAHTGQWQRVGTGITEGVSGLAVLSSRGDHVEALSVIDNKKPGQERVRRIVLDDGRVTAVRPMTWQGETPVDLEAVAGVPHRPGEYVAVTSGSRAFHVRVRRDVVTVVAAFDLPPHDPQDNMESFALRAVGSRLAAVWADRGAGVRTSTLYSAYFSLQDHTFGPVTTVEYDTGAHEETVRHASDIAIRTDGSVLVSSAVDPGDDGPFSSSLREIGRLVPRKDTVGVGLARRPHLLGTFGGRKIEAVTLLRGGDVLLGTDDENDGGWVLRR